MFVWDRVDGMLIHIIIMYVNKYVEGDALLFNGESRFLKLENKNFFVVFCDPKIFLVFMSRCRRFFQQYVVYLFNYIYQQLYVLIPLPN